MPNTTSNNGTINNGTDLRERKVDLFSRSIKDFKGGRATNCGPSQASTDYVIKSELDAAISGIKTSTGSSAAPSTNITTSTYILDILGILYIGSNLTPRRYITITKIPSLIRFDVIGAPTGHTLDIQLYQNTTLYLSSSIAISGNSKTLTSAEITAAGILTAGNYLRLDITAVGSTYRGDNLTVTIVQ